MDVVLNEFIEKVDKNYLENERRFIKDALLLSNARHANQRRKSGEPYIIHPISVASILCDMKADKETIAAALLHDVIEDTDTTKEELSIYFGDEVAELVDGVTKIKSTTFYTKEESKAAYIRKLTTSILKDVRIIIIKLIDRLHNMETLQFQSRDKQIKIAKETLDIYVPLAYYLGIYKVRFLLEDLAFKYLDEEMYEEISQKQEKIIEDGNVILDDMIDNLEQLLSKNNIKCEFEKSSKNVYGIYKRLYNGDKLSNIADLLRIKIIVNNVSECYQVLGLIHSLYRPINAKFKDYISSPKNNMYQALHTTIFANSNRLVQFQIRTKEMNDIDVYGIINCWLNNQNKGDIQKYLVDNFPFVTVLREINAKYSNNDEFMGKLYHDVLKEKVYIIMGSGNIMELPKGSTLKDLCDTLGINENRLVVNNEEKPLDYILQSNDCVSDVKRKIKELK